MIQVVKGEPISEKTVHGYWGGDEAIAYLTDDCCEKIENSIGWDAAERIYNDRDL